MSNSSSPVPHPSWVGRLLAEIGRWLARAITLAAAAFAQALGQALARAFGHWLGL